MKRNTKRLLCMFLIICLVVTGTSSFAFATDVPQVPETTETINSAADDSSNAQAMATPRSVKDFVFNEAVGATSGYFVSFSGNYLSASVSVGPSTKISSMRVRLYRHYSSSEAGQILISEKIVPANGATTSLFGGVPIVPNALYYFEFSASNYAPMYPAQVYMYALSYV